MIRIPTVRPSVDATNALGVAAAGLVLVAGVSIGSTVAVGNRGAYLAAAVALCGLAVAVSQSSWAVGLPFLVLVLVPSTRLTSVRLGPVSLQLGVTIVAVGLALLLWLVRDGRRPSSTAASVVGLLAGCWLLFGIGAGELRTIYPTVMALVAGVIVAAIPDKRSRSSVDVVLIIIGFTAVLGILEMARVIPSPASFFSAGLRAGDVTGGLVRSVSTFGRPLPFGAACAIGASIAFACATPRIKLGALLTAGAVVSLSRGALVAEVVGVVVALLLRPRDRALSATSQSRAIMGIVGLAATVLLLALSPAGSAVFDRFGGANAEDTPRSQVLDLVRDQATGHPLGLLVGHGPGTTQRRLEAIGGNAHGTLVPDNQWVVLILELGLIPLAVAISLTIVGFINAPPPQRAIGVAALSCAVILFGVFDTLNWPPIAFLVAWALAYGTMPSSSSRDR
jgi:hypothetical protein